MCVVSSFVCSTLLDFSGALFKNPCGGLSQSLKFKFVHSVNNWMEIALGNRYIMYKRLFYYDSYM